MPDKNTLKDIQTGLIQGKQCVLWNRIISVICSHLNMIKYVCHI